MTMLDKLSAEETVEIRVAWWAVPGEPCGDDIEIYRDVLMFTTVSHHLRQRTEKVGFASYCLADFVAPKLSGKADYIGAFAVTGGLEGRMLAADAFEACATIQIMVRGDCRPSGGSVCRYTA